MLRKAFLLLFLIPFALASPTINEAMPNPLNESNEWVEIFSPDTIDLSEWTIGDSNSNDTIACTSCAVSGYFLIIGNSASIAAINSSATYFVTDDSKIGNGLSNTADCIRFFSPAASSSFCWNSTSEESSFSLRSDGSWLLCENSTPGGPNACDAVQQGSQGSGEEQQPAQQEPPAQQTAEENIVLKAYLTSGVYAGTTYEDLFKVVIKNKQDCSEKDSVKVSFNISGEGTFYTSSWAREVGCSGYDGTGFWMPDLAGSYKICGEVTETSAGDSEPSDNKICWTVSASGAAQPEAAEESAPEEIRGAPAAVQQKEPEPVAEEASEAQEKQETPAKAASGELSFADIFMMLANFLYKTALLIR